MPKQIIFSIFCFAPVQKYIIQTEAIHFFFFFFSINHVSDELIIVSCLFERIVHSKTFLCFAIQQLLLDICFK